MRDAGGGEGGPTTSAGRFLIGIGYPLAEWGKGCADRAVEARDAKRWLRAIAWAATSMWMVALSMRLLPIYQWVECLNEEDKKDAGDADDGDRGRGEEENGG